MVLIAIGAANRVRAHSKHLAHHAISALYRLRKRRPIFGFGSLHGLAPFQMGQQDS
jgi:hypothetical protein